MEDDDELEEMINKINLFLNSENIHYQFKTYDLIKIKKIFEISNLSIILKKMEKTRKINFIINSKNKFKLKYDLNNNKYFLLLEYYYITKFNKILESTKLFYKSNLISFHTIILFLDYFLFINEENKKNVNLYIINIIEVISFLKKIIKITEKVPKDDKNIINNKIHKLVGKIFSIYNMQRIQNIIICQNLVKFPKILSILKLCYHYYDNNILSKENKLLIINNSKNLFTNNLNYVHLNYLYKISNKYLKSNFNNKNKKAKNYYSFYNGIINFFEQIMNNKNPNLLDKYFIFNSPEDKNGILITSPVSLTDGINYTDLNISFIFSFIVIKSDDKNNLNNNGKVLLSVNDYSNNKYIFRFVINRYKLYLNTFTDNILLMDNIKNNTDYLCYAYFDENEKLFHFNSNKDNKILKQKIIKKETSQIYLELGNTIYDHKGQIRKFNGLIGPIFVFNSKVDNPLDIYQKLSKMKKYYLLGDFIINPNKKENIYFSFDEYYGISYNKNELINIISDLKRILKNLIFYINPEVISNNLNFYNGNRFRDYQIYNNPFDSQNHQNKGKYYEINDETNINNFLFIQNSFIEFVINNNIFDYFVFNIEMIYNELLQMNYNNISDNEYNIL